MSTCMNIQYAIKISLKNHLRSFQSWYIFLICVWKMTIICWYSSISLSHWLETILKVGMPSSLRKNKYYYVSRISSVISFIFTISIIHIHLWKVTFQENLWLSNQQIKTNFMQWKITYILWNSSEVAHLE